MLPDMDGFAVLDALEHDHRLRDIPVVILSAKELTAAEARRLEQHAVLMVPKAQFNRDEFLARVKVILG